MKKSQSNKAPALDRATPREMVTGQISYRELQLRAEDIDQESRSINLSFSSETAVDRFGTWREILDHNKKSVRMSRLKDQSAPLLLDHDRATQLGVIESAEIGEDKRGRAVARFSKSARASEIFEDVLDGIRKLVSVGYRIHDWIQEGPEDGGEMPTFRITDWEPVEISIVSIPADVTVGIGRHQTIDDYTFRKVQKMDEENKITVVPAPAAPAVDTVKIEASARASERERAAEILEIGANFDMLGEARAALANGQSVDQFRAQVLEKFKAAAGQPIDAKRADIGMSEGDVKSYSLLRALNAQLTGDWRKAGYERECSDEVSKRIGRPAQGFFVPDEYLRAYNPALAGLQKREVTAASEPELIGTQVAAGSFIEMLRNKTAVIRGGATVLSGLVQSVDIPRQTGGVVFGWVADGSSQALSDPTFDSVSLTPKILTGGTQASRLQLQQSNPSIEALIMNDVFNGIAVGLDAGAISGTGASNQPQGVIGASGVGSVSAVAAVWADIIEFETDVLAGNAGDLGTPVWMAAAAVNGICKTRVKESGNAAYLNEGGEMNGYKVEVTQQVPASHLILGIWSQLIIGLWGGLDLLVDPYTAGAAGSLVIRGFQTADIGVRNPAAFSISTDFS